MQFVQTAVAFLLLSMITTAQAAPCTSGYAYRQYVECPNTAKPIFQEDTGKICPGDARCVPETYTSCAHPNHGMAEATELLANTTLDTKPVEGKDRDGQVRLCQALVSEFNRDNEGHGVSATFVRLRPEFENAKKQNYANIYVRYVYTCEVQKKRHAFVTKATENCPVATYKIKLDDVRERSKACVAVEPKLERVATLMDLMKVKGVQASTCMSCSTVLDPQKQNTCIQNNLAALVYNDNNAMNVATAEDKVEMAKTACKVMKEKLTNEDPGDQEPILLRIVEDTKTVCE